GRPTGRCMAARERKLLIPVVGNTRPSNGWPLAPSRGVGYSPFGSTYRRDDKQNPENHPCRRSALLCSARGRAGGPVPRLLVSHAVWGGCAGGWVERDPRAGWGLRRLHRQQLRHRWGAGCRAWGSDGTSGSNRSSHLGLHCTDLRPDRFGESREVRVDCRRLNRKRYLPILALVAKTLERLRPVRCKCRM